MTGIQPIEQPVLVKVRRQPDDWRIATYDLTRVYRLRWDNVGGGVQRGSAMHVYGYVLCDGLIDGELAHSCRHGPPPHEIKVCITKKYNEYGRRYFRSSVQNPSDRVRKSKADDMSCATALANYQSSSVDPAAGQAQFTS